MVWYIMKNSAATVPYGMPVDEAFKVGLVECRSNTRNWELLGSIEEDKTADLILSDGNPLDGRTTRIWSRSAGFSGNAFKTTL